MAKSPEELLALRIGGATVGENLQRAIASGEVIENADGSLQLPDGLKPNRDWIREHDDPPMGCKFLMHFLFVRAYAKAAVPQGCSACYKVKIVPRTLRELVATWEIGKRIACQSKWGIDLDNPYSQDVYAGYFFASGLEMARAIYKAVREAIDKDAKLGPHIAMTIKRGCSDYEAALGPSDRYEFAPELAELETYLKSRFRDGESAEKKSIPLVNWIDLAFRMGDDTYLDFTGGRRLRPKTLTYDP